MDSNQLQGKYDWAQGANLIALAGLVSLVLRRAFSVELPMEDATTVIVAVSVVLSLFLNKKEKNLTLGGFRK